jgi:hypothetical protein
MKRGASPSTLPSCQSYWDGRSIRGGSGNLRFGEAVILLPRSFFLSFIQLAPWSHEAGDEGKVLSGTS